MDDQVFELLMKRFDTLEEQGLKTQSLLAKHVDDDEKVHRTVERHAIYWSILLLGIPSTMTYVSKKMGWV